MAAKKKPKAPLYDWGDGRKVHTIPKSTYEQNKEARGYGINLDAPTSAPLSNRQTYGAAEKAADLEYAPQIQAAQQLQQSVPTWYANHQAQVAAQAAAVQAYASPLLQQAQQGVTNASATTAPGLDPSSQQYGVEQQAAQGRQSIAQLGYDTLAAIPTAATGYLAGQSAVAARELPQVQAQYGQRVGELQGQRGAAVSKAYGDLRGQEQNASIAYGTLNLNADRAAADTDIARGVDPVTGKDLPVKPEDPYTSGAFSGYTPSQVRTKSKAWKDKKKNEYNSVVHPPTPKGSTTEEVKKAEAEKKRIEGVRAKSGEFSSRITDAVGDWELLTKEPVQLPDTEKIDEKSHKKVKVPGGTRKASIDEVRRAMRSKGYTPQEIHIALLRRVKKPLDQAAIDYMHAKGLRIPRDWLPAKSKHSGNPTPDQADRTRAAERNR